MKYTIEEFKNICELLTSPDESNNLLGQIYIDEHLAGISAMARDKRDFFFYQSRPIVGKKKYTRSSEWEYKSVYEFKVTNDLHPCSPYYHINIAFLDNDNVSNLETALKLPFEAGVYWLSFFYAFYLGSIPAFYQIEGISRPSKRDISQLSLFSL